MPVHQQVCFTRSSVSAFRSWLLVSSLFVTLALPRCQGEDRSKFQHDPVLSG